MNAPANLTDATEGKSLYDRMQEAAADTPDDAFAGEE